MLSRADHQQIRAAATTLDLLAPSRSRPTAPPRTANSSAYSQHRAHPATLSSVRRRRRTMGAAATTAVRQRTPRPTRIAYNTPMREFRLGREYTTIPLILAGTLVSCFYNPSGITKSEITDSSTSTGPSSSTSIEVLPGFEGLLSWPKGHMGEIEPSAVEEDRGLEVVPVAEPAGGVLELLDLTVRAFGDRVGDAVREVAQNA